ncbi:hypothetical protein N1851_019260 [Merluccius polli]|uniref:Peptidase A2 domain-containing protein n=1 Tax=Merluccius polli TaxID=89951 RepID=A0AA47MML5_MERPO|nr:hypothetical protein N1851_019260 [Merluccius polli]
MPRKRGNMPELPEEGSMLEEPWVTDVSLHGHNIQFKLDTGAEVTVISDSLYHRLQTAPLQHTTKRLYGPSRIKLDVRGKFTANLKVGQQSSKQTTYVVRGLHTALLGCNAITALGLVKRADISSINSSPRRFPGLFEGIGKLEGEYPHCHQVPILNHLP